MPMLCPSYNPAPKSGCSGVDAPMKLIIALELGSTVAPEISWFHALSAGNGINPFKLAPRPRLIWLQDCPCAEAIAKIEATNAQSKRLRRIRNRRMICMPTPQEGNEWTERTLLNVRLAWLNRGSR